MKRKVLAEIKSRDVKLDKPCCLPVSLEIRGSLSRSEISGVFRGLGSP